MANLRSLFATNNVVVVSRLNEEIARAATSFFKQKLLVRAAVCRRASTISPSPSLACVDDRKIPSVPYRNADAAHTHTDALQRLPPQLLKRASLCGLVLDEDLEFRFTDAQRKDVATDFLRQSMVVTCGGSRTTQYRKAIEEFVLRAPDGLRVTRVKWADCKAPPAHLILIGTNGEVTEALLKAARGDRSAPQPLLLALDILVAADEDDGFGDSFTGKEHKPPIVLISELQARSMLGQLGATVADVPLLPVEHMYVHPQPRQRGGAGGGGARASFGAAGGVGRGGGSPAAAASPPQEEEEHAKIWDAVYTAEFVQSLQAGVPRAAAAQAAALIADQTCGPRRHVSYEGVGDFGTPHAAAAAGASPPAAVGVSPRHNCWDYLESQVTVSNRNGNVGRVFSRCSLCGTFLRWG